MATFTRRRMRVGYTISGNSPEVRNLYEGASQTYKAGAVCFLSASKRMRALPTANLSRADVGQGLAGVATKDAGNYTNSTTQVPFYVINDDTVWIGNIASRFSAATATLQIAHIGSVCGASVTNSGVFPSIRMVAATNSLMMVRGFVEGSAVGDTYAEVYFQFLKAARAFR